MADKVTIRETTEEDIDAILAIDKKIVGDDRAITYRDPIGFYLGGEFGMSFAAEADGNIVGFALGRLRDPDIGWLQAVAIDPGYRRQDIGTRLVEAFVERCRSKGVKTIHTVVSWRDWEMLSFLNSLGFTRGEMIDLQMTL
jgi:N-acetylglutamate synthase-like GNAT family acetyltransferase